MLAIPTQAVKKRIKIRIIMDNHKDKKNEKSSKERKRKQSEKHRWIKTPATEKKNPAYS